MSEMEFIVMLVFVGMGVYISYLSHELRKARHAVGMMVMLVSDIADGDVEVERKTDGIRINRTKFD